MTWRYLLDTNVLSEPLHPQPNPAVTVTHDREPLVIIYPASPQPQRLRFGVMKGSGEILGDVIVPVIPQTSESRIRQIQG